MSDVQDGRAVEPIPHIEDAITVLEGLLRDAARVSGIAHHVVDAFGDLHPTDRIKLGERHPELLSALLTLEDWSHDHRELAV
jgi:hypothetical protein